MCQAGVAAESSAEKDSTEQLRFRRFLFIYTTVIMHELTHLFVTFLCWGQVNTPPHLRSEVGTGSSDKKGESGHAFAELLFNGEITVTREETEDENQVSIWLPIG